MKEGPVLPRGQAAPGTWDMELGQAVVVGGGSSEICLPQLGGCVYRWSSLPLPCGTAVAGQWLGLPGGEKGSSAL